MFWVPAAAFAIAAIWSWRVDPRQLRIGVFAVFAAGFGVLALASSDVGIASEVAAALVLAAVLVLPVAVVAAALFLIVNGLIMVRKERLTLGNLVSLVTGVGMLVLIGVTLAMISLGSITAALAILIILVVGYLAFVFVCFAAYSFIYSRRSLRSKQIDAIAVLGSRVVNGRVPPLLAARLARAEQIYRAQLGAGHPAPLLVPSGGQGSDESEPEGAAMGNYLVAHGVPSTDVVPETAAATTEQNLIFSRRLVDELRPGGTMVVVTNDYHAFRTALQARRLRIDTHAVGAPTARYFLPSAYLREFVAVLRQNWLLHAVVIAALALGVFGLLIISLSPLGFQPN